MLNYHERPWLFITVVCLILCITFFLLGVVALYFGFLGLADILTTIGQFLVIAFVVLAIIQIIALYIRSFLD